MIWIGAAGNRLVGEVFEADGPGAAIMLHGGGQTRHTWRRAAKRLQQQGIACLTFDQRGHGDSAWIDSGDYRLDDFLADCERVLDGWQRPCVLVGTSLGGLVSMMAASTQHPLIRGLAMIDTAPQLNPKEIDWLVEFLGGEAQQGFESPAAAAAHLQRFFPDLDIEAESIEKSLRQGPDGRWHRHWDVRVVLGERNSIALPHEVELHERARRIRIPFALVRAGASDLVSDAAIERLRGCAPQLELIEMPGLHHLFSSDESLQIIERINGFMQQALRS